MHFFVIFLLFLNGGLLLQSCQFELESVDQLPTQIVVENNTESPESSHIILPTIQFSPSPMLTETEISPSPTPTPTEIPCLETTGKINEVAFTSQILGEDILTNVYLPPCYDPNRSPGYPLLMMLHGQNGNQDQWVDLGLTNLADEWIRTDRISPLVIVMPFERLFLMDSNRSQYDAALVEDLLPLIMEQYNLRTEWEMQAIGGLSRGANWAVRISLNNPQVFGSMGAHSFTTFTGDMSRVQDWVQSLSSYKPRLWFDIGEGDQYRKYSEPFVLFLQQNQYSLEYSVNPGGHTVDYWKVHVPEYLTWYSQNW